MRSRSAAVHLAFLGASALVLTFLGTTTGSFADAAAPPAAVDAPTPAREDALLPDALLPNARPIPRLQVVPQPYDQAAISRDGQEIARYHFGKTLHRPFLFPLIGPAGRSLTRMGHPRDPNSHSHHNSVWISHHDVDGVDFWGDGGKGRIVHRRVVRYEDSDAEALVETANVWTGEGGAPLLEEQRRMRFRPLTDGQWLLAIDLHLQPPAGPAPAKNSAPSTPRVVTLGKTPFGMIGVRMAKTIGVHDGGGRIRNSEGAEGEPEVFWKPARWVDYSGLIARGQAEGVTLFDHPHNPRHPAIFHVRADGWMGASLTHAAPLTVSREQPLHLRYGLFVHAGVPETAALERQFQEFVDLPEPSFPPTR